MFPAPFPFKFGSGRLNVVIPAETEELTLSILPAQLRFAATALVSEPANLLFELQQPILKFGKKLSAEMYEQIFDTSSASVRRGIRLSLTSATLNCAFDPAILKRGLKLVSDIAQITIQYLECLVRASKKGILPALAADLELSTGQTQLRSGVRLKSFTEPITFNVETPYLKIPVAIFARLIQVDLLTGHATVQVGIRCPTVVYELSVPVNIAALQAGSRLSTGSGAFDVAGYVTHLVYKIMGHFIELLSKIKDPIELESKIQELITLKSVITRLKEG